MPGVIPWNKVVGLIGALIATLFSLGWQLPAADLWVSPAQVAFAIGVVAFPQMSKNARCDPVGPPDVTVPPKNRPFTFS